MKHHNKKLACILLTSLYGIYIYKYVAMYVCNTILICTTMETYFSFMKYVKLSYFYF